MRNKLHIFLSTEPNFHHEQILCLVVRFYELKEDYFQQILSNLILHQPKFML